MSKHALPAQPTGFQLTSRSAYSPLDFRPQDLARGYSKAAQRRIHNLPRPAHAQKAASK